MRPALKGPNYSVTAGEQSEPAEEGAHHLRPQGGRTTAKNDRRNISAARHALTRRPRRWTPMGPSSPLTVFRGFATLTRGYRIVRPRWGRRPRGSTRPDRCVTPYPLRERSELYRTHSHPPMWPALKGPNYSVTAGERSEPCEDASHPLMPPALKGPNYSITAGERSEPAEGGAHHLRPQGGRTTTRNNRRNISAARHALTRRPRRCPPMGPSSPLTVFRGFATLTPRYRIVRPRWGRRPRGSTRPDRCVTP